MKGMTLGHNMATYNLLIILALVALTGIAAFDLLVKPGKEELKQQTELIESQKEQELADLNLQYRLEQARLDEMEAKLEAKTWLGNFETVSPVILDEVTDLARARGVNVRSFRPQKIVERDGLSQLTYAISVEGGYLAVLALVDDLEGEQPRLTVTQLQIAGTDAASDRVSASIGVAAFLKSLDPEEAPARG